LLLVAAGGCSPYAGERTYEEVSQTLEGVSFSEKSLGKPLWELTSEKGTLLEDKGLAELSEPKVMFYQDGRPSARARARRGTVEIRTREISLSTSVVLHSFLDQSELRTESLRYSSGRGLLYTELPVEVRRPGAWVRGEGLQATPDLREVRIQKQKTLIHK